MQVRLSWSFGPTCSPASDSWPARYGSLWNREDALATFLTTVACQTAGRPVNRRFQHGRPPASTAGAHGVNLELKTEAGASFRGSWVLLRAIVPDMWASRPLTGGGASRRSTVREGSSLRAGRRSAEILMSTRAPALDRGAVTLPPNAAGAKGREDFTGTESATGRERHVQGSVQFSRSGSGLCSG